MCRIEQLPEQLGWHLLLGVSYCLGRSKLDILAKWSFRFSKLFFSASPQLNLLSSDNSRVKGSV